VDSHSVFQALQLAVSPVILISASGLLLLSMTNRLGRAIDRARLLVREGAAKEDQITIITQRAGWIRSAIVFTSLALIAAGLLVLVLFASIYLPFNIAPVVAVLFIGSLVSVVVGLGYFIADIYGSLHAMQAELQEASRSKVADRS
jgi:hypothetical protein